MRKRPLTEAVGCSWNTLASLGLRWWQYMIVWGWEGHWLETEVTSSRKADLSPRTQLHLSDPTLSLKLCRRRFAIKIAFAMKIRNAQGQTLKHAAGYTPLPAVCGIFPDPIHLTASLLQLLKVVDSARKMIAWWRHCISRRASNFPIINKSEFAG